MIRKIGLPIALLFLVLSGYGQNGLSFYHLGNATFQNNQLNPSLVPDGKVFLGLPVVSGVHINFNNKFAYKDFIVQGETQKEIDLNVYLKSLQQNNMVHVSTNINLFHLGISTKPGSLLSFFANERIETDFLYHKSLMEFMIEGNGAHLDDEIELSKTRLDLSYFREYGVGFSTTLQSIGVNVGIRAKYLQGMANASTDPAFRADLTTNREDYALNLELENGMLRTSGFDILQGNTGNLGTHLASNNNRGAALDLGMSWDMNRRISLSTSLLDLGFISWQDDIKNHTIGDTSMVYRGINLQNPDKLEETIKDSLINRFKNKKTESYQPYNSLLSPKWYVSGAYHLNSRGDLMGTVGTRYTMGQLKLMMGVGYQHRIGKFLVSSINVTKLPQQFLNIGGSLAVRGGPMQFYLAADQLLLFDMTRFNSIDVRFGVNFIFGRHNKNTMVDSHAPKQRGRSSGGIQSFLGGNKVKVKGKEGIYTIIKEQEPRSKNEYIRRKDPMPDDNYTAAPMFPSEPNKPTENPNRNDAKSAPPANAAQRSNNRGGVRSIAPVKPSVNKNYGSRPLRSGRIPGGDSSKKTTIRSAAPQKPSKNHNFGNFTRKSKPIPGGSNRSKVRTPRKEFKPFKSGKKRRKRRD